MKKRKFMALTLSCVMVCTLAACGGKDAGADQTAANPAPAEKTETPAETPDAENPRTRRRQRRRPQMLHRQRISRCGRIRSAAGGIRLRLMV